MVTRTLGLNSGLRNFTTAVALAAVVNASTFSAPEITEVYNDGGAVADTTSVVFGGWSGGSSTCATTPVC